MAPQRHDQRSFKTASFRRYSSRAYIPYLTAVFFLACFFLLTLSPAIALDKANDSLVKENPQIPDSIGKAIPPSQSGSIVVSKNISDDSLTKELTFDTLSVKRKAATVRFSGTTLITLYHPLGIFSAEERANRMREEIERFVDSDRVIDSISVLEGQRYSTLLLNQNALIQLTDEDAISAGIPREQLAQDLAYKVKSVLSEYQDETSFKHTLQNLLFAVLLLALGSVLWRVIDFGKEKIAHLHLSISKRSEVLLKFRGFEILSVKAISVFLERVTSLLIFTLRATLIYGILTSVLSLFIWTRPISERLLTFVLEPTFELLKGFLNYFPNIIIIIIIIIIFRYAARLSDVFFRSIESGRLKFEGFYPEWADPTRKIVRFMLYLFAAVLIYPYSPLATSTAAQGISIFVGVLFSIGSSTLIGNMVAGIMLNYTRSFRIGDTIRIGDNTGNVSEKTLFVTKLRTRYNEEVSIPNMTVLSSNVMNFSESVRRGEKLILHATITIGYDVPWRKVHQLLIDAALITPEIVPDPAPFVFQLALSDSYPVYEINAFTPRPSLWLDTYTKLYANIQDKFAEAGVEILSPSYHVNRLTLETTLPPESRPKEYTVPPIIHKAP